MRLRAIDRVLTTRVGRRLLLLLLLSAVVPFSMFTLLAYREVASQLEDQARTNFRRSAKSVGLAVFDRLKLLDGNLANRIALARGAGSFETFLDDTTSLAPRQFLGAAVVGAAGRADYGGGIGPLPALEPAEWARLAEGRAVLRTRRSPRTSILLARALAPGDPSSGVVWAEVNPASLWGGAEGDLGTASGALCVFDDKDLPLVCPLPSSLELIAHARDQRHGLDTAPFEWSDADGEVWLGGYWTLFLRYQFHTEGWTVLFVEPRSGVLAAMEDFRSLVPPLALLTVLIVVFLSHGEIRRRLAPLAQLRAATQHLGDGDFSARVDVTSGDEFEELAGAFNGMTERLRSEFTRRTEATRALEERTRALEVSDVRLRTILDAAADGIVTMDGEGRITRLNHTAVRLFGLDRESALGMPGSFLFTEPPNWSDLGAAGSVAGRGVEVGCRRSDGSVFPAELVVRNVAPGGLRLTTAFIRDLSERFAAEEERKELERALLQSQKMETVGTLAGGIAHDFNNLLTPILGHVDLALLDAPPGSELEEGLNEARQAAVRARNLVRQILLFSRRSASERTPVRLSELVEEVQKLLRATLPATVEIVSDAPKPGPWVTADETQLQQVLMNLCTNASHAIKASPSGAGRITIVLDEVDAPSRSSTGPRTTRYARIRVSDTGVGIPDHVRERIFEPFFTTKGPGQGTGLGLSVVHGIVTDHGGRIELDSTLGVGTTFSILIPVSAAREEALAAAETPPESGCGERLLLVDDEASVARAASRMLTHLGYEVAIATSGEEARDRFAEDPDHFQLVVTDHTMPGMTGLQLVQELRALRPGVRVVLMSGDAKEALEELVEGVDLQGIVQKPFDLKRLSEVVRSALLPRIARVA